MSGVVESLRSIKQVNQEVDRFPLRGQGWPLAGSDHKELSVRVQSRPAKSPGGVVRDTAELTGGAMMPIVCKLGTVATVPMTLMVAASPSVASSSTPSSSPPASSTGKQTTTATKTRQPQDVDSVYFLTPRVGWASEDNSARLLMTTDGGASWRNVSPPMLRRAGFALASGLTGAAFLSPADFFVSVYDSGADEFLPVFRLHTTDSGRKWTEVGSF